MMLDPKIQLKLLLQNRTTAYLPHPTRDHRSVPRLIPQGHPFTVTFELEHPTGETLENPKLWDKIPTWDFTPYHHDVARALMQWRVPEGVEDAIRKHLDAVQPDVATRHALPTFGKFFDRAIDELTQPVRAEIWNRHLLEAAIEILLATPTPHPNHPDQILDEDNISDLTDHQIFAATPPDLLQAAAHKLAMPLLAHRYEPRWDNLFADLPELTILHPTTNCHYTIFAVATPTQVFTARGDSYGSGTREVLGYYGYGFGLLPHVSHYGVKLDKTATLTVTKIAKAPYDPRHGCNYKPPT